MMSAVASTAAEPPSAARAGADLKQARERLGLTLDDVAAALRIRLPHLRALEEGRILLPGSAYTLAFVRAYATALGLDPREMVRRFRTEAAFSRHTELIFPIPMPDRALPAGAVVLLGVILVIGTYAGWYRLSGEGRLPAETVTAIPERLASLAEQAFPSAAVSGSQAPVPKLAGVPVPDAPATLMDTMLLAGSNTPTPQVMPISPTSAAAAQLAGLSVDGMPDAGRPKPVLAGDINRIVLRATADTWFLVKDRGGAVLLNRTMKAGETWLVPPRRDLVLTTGNAGGTDILIDGTAIPDLRGSASVHRDIALDPEQIIDRRWVSPGVPQLPRAHQ